MNFRAIRAVILDFDGVIVESAGIKKRAYRQLFEEEFSEHLDPILEYQESLGGLPRRRQFEEIYARILREKMPPGRVDELEARYVHLMLERVMDAPFVPGAMEFLEAFHRKHHLYIASATPEEELSQIVRERALERFFRNVYGSPMNKTQILRLIAKNSRFAPGEMVFIGDYPTDRDAADEAGVPFIARLGSTAEMEKCPNQIQDLTELPALLRSMYLTENS